MIIIPFLFGFNYVVFIFINYNYFLVCDAKLFIVFNNTIVKRNVKLMY